MDYETLYAYLSQMDEKERKRRVEAGILFVQSKGMLPFKAEEIMENITRTIIEELKNI